MAVSTIKRDKGTEWYLRYLDWTPSNAWGAFPSGSNVAQSKQFKFSSAVSWTGIFPSALVQHDAIEAHIVPVNNTTGKVNTRNLTSASVSATTVRLYFLVTDPSITVSWS